MGATVTGPSVRDPSRGEKRALAYVEWRLACIAVCAAYRDWTRATRADAVLAHAVYEAALDREDAAATAYARLMKPACDPIGGPGSSRSADHAYHAPREEG
jgi:hypothetical protein